jgi:hypothetical protein
LSFQQQSTEHLAEKPHQHMVALNALFPDMVRRADSSESLSQFECYMHFALRAKPV